jgi:SAM-dependent methyltransferase
MSVGCGAGVTEGELVKRGVEVVGIELNPVAARAARRRGINVLEGDAAAVNADRAADPFDCLLYADVLEHIADPLAVMRAHVQLLRKGGTVIVSVPNFRHYEVFWQIFVRGQVRYVDAGIFDRTHLRITTRRMVEGWFGDVGLTPVAADYPMPRRRDRWPARLSLGTMREFCARQVIVVGRLLPAVTRDGKI